MTQQSISEEVEAINGEAIDLAESVVENPTTRTRHAERAQQLSLRLADLAGEFKRINPTEYRRQQRMISDSLLDLDYVLSESEIISPRLGRIIDHHRANRNRP